MRVSRERVLDWVRQPATLGALIVGGAVIVVALFVLAIIWPDDRDALISAAVAVGTLLLAVVAVLSLDQARVQSAEAARQADAKSVEEARLAEIADAPLLRVKYHHQQFSERALVIFDLECVTASPVLDARLTMREEYDRGEPLADSKPISSARLSVVALGAPGQATVDLTSFASGDKENWKLRREWYQVVASFRGRLGTRVEMTFDWAADDAPHKKEGAPGFGDRWLLRRVRIEPTRGEPVDTQMPLL